MGETFAGETFARWKTREFYGIYFRECRFRQNFAGFIFANGNFEKFLRDKFSRIASNFHESARQYLFWEYVPEF